MAVLEFCFDAIEDAYVLDQHRALGRCALVVDIEGTAASGQRAIIHHGAAGGSDSFGLFERWILRLGYFTSRRDAQAFDADVFGEELLVLLNPDHPPDDAFLQRLDEYVSGGGKLLVVESPLAARRPPEDADEGENEPVALQRTFVNHLLEPFGILVDHGLDASGTLSVPDGWPQVPVEQALAVEGGTAFATVDGVHHKVPQVGIVVIEDGRIVPRPADLSGFTRIDATGLVDPELQVRFFPELLEEVRLTPGQIADTVSAFFQDIGFAPEFIHLLAEQAQQILEQLEIIGELLQNPIHHILHIGVDAPFQIGFIDPMTTGFHQAV